MRPIDADELKKALNANCDTLCPDKNTNWCEHCCPHNDFEDLIDNAPTVEPCYQTTSCLDCKNYDKENYYCPRFCEVIKEITEEIKRPQCEWIKMSDRFGEYYACNVCGYDRANYKSDFCPNCGADMRGKKE